MRITRLGRTALDWYSLIAVGIGCIPFFEWEEMVVEGRLTNDSLIKGLNNMNSNTNIGKLFWILQGKNSQALHFRHDIYRKQVLRI